MERLLLDVSRSRGDQPGFHLWWLGGGCVLLQSQRRHVLIDPCSGALPQLFEPMRFDFIDLVCLTRAPGSSASAAETRALLLANPEAQVCVPAAHRTSWQHVLGAPGEWLLGLEHERVISVRDVQAIGLSTAAGEVGASPAREGPPLAVVLWLGAWTVSYCVGLPDSARFWHAMAAWRIDLGVSALDAAIEGAGQRIPPMVAAAGVARHVLLGGELARRPVAEVFRAQGLKVDLPYAGDRVEA